MSKPPKSILDRSFPYVPSHNTDITVTWDRARKKLEQDRRERDTKVRDIKHIGVKK